MKGLMALFEWTTDMIFEDKLRPCPFFMTLLLKKLIAESILFSADVSPPITSTRYTYVKIWCSVQNNVCISRDFGGKIEKISLWWQIIYGKKRGKSYAHPSF